MKCQICKNSATYVEYSADNQIMICSVCRNRFNNEILLVCDVCDAMCFIPKNFKNIERLKFFIQTSFADFMLEDVIVPMHGCPHCVSFKNNVLGEVKEEYQHMVKVSSH